MEKIKKILVSLQFREEEISVGELIADNKRIFFKYYSDFIERGLDISPIKLKFNTEIQIANETPFEGIFGVFADSLPDGWGKLLLDKSLAAKGISIGDITILDRLAYVGNNGMGALTYKPEILTESISTFKIELDEISQATQQIIAGTPTEVLDELFQLGGSSGGARPKILVGYNAITQHLISETTILPPGYEHWLIKFPSSQDWADITNIEYAYYKMAIDAGLEMSESKLFQGKSGMVYFGTKRFDRIGNHRLHLHSAAGIMHDNFRLSTLDYGHLMDCAFKLEKDVGAFQKVLRLAAFNVFTHNRDDHSKNCSFLMDANGKWRLAPAYDLTFSYASHGMHSTMVAGESANPSKKQLLELAHYFQVKNGIEIIDGVQHITRQWKSYAKEAGLSKESTNRIHKIISQMG